MNCIFAAHIEYRNISTKKNCQPVQNPLILYYPHAYPPPILSHPMHALSLFCPTPCMPSPYSVPPHACPPPILSHPCMSSPYSIPPHAYPPHYSIPAHAYPPHAYPPPILSHSMHTLPLFYPSSCTPSPYSMPAYTHTPPYFIPPHACPLSILLHPYMPSVVLSHLCMSMSPCMFSTSPHMHPQYSIPSHTCPPNSLSHEPGRQVSPLTSENAAFESVHTEYIIIIYLA